MLSRKSATNEYNYLKAADIVLNYNFDLSSSRIGQTNGHTQDCEKLCF